MRRFAGAGVKGEALEDPRAAPWPSLTPSSFCPAGSAARRLAARRLGEQGVRGVVAAADFAATAATPSATSIVPTGQPDAHLLHNVGAGCLSKASFSSWAAGASLPELSGSSLLSRAAAASAASQQRSGLAAALAAPQASRPPTGLLVLPCAAVQRQQPFRPGTRATSSARAGAGASAGPAAAQHSAGGSSIGPHLSPAAQFERWLDSMRARGFAVRQEYWKRSVKLDGEGGKLRLWITQGAFNRLPWLAAGSAGVFLAAGGGGDGLAAAVAYLAMWRWPVGVFALAGGALMWQAGQEEGEGG